ncbi:MAG: hypothetical protein JWQ83_1553 [Lacunisphaera sp.]|nr:hypothetical protein [Lacunisphaera sp.]
MIRAFQWDVGRQIERLDFLKDLLPRYAAWGYQELYLHLEDAVEYPSLPGVGRDDAYTYQELGELVLAAAQNGIRVVPIVNLLGHTQYLIKHPACRDLNELRDERGQPLEHGQLCPLHPRTLEVAELLLRDMAPYCSAGKVHVGLDESFHLGKCPRCREEVARIGLAGHFAGHVTRLHGITQRLNLQLGLWADMLYFVPAAIPLLPRGIIAYDWYYYPFAQKPRVEFFNFAEHDLQPALKKQGIGYYGCPMNGAFRHEPLPVFGDRFGNIRSWWQRCHAVEADGFFVTSWEANRLALETTTLVDAGAASLWLEPDADDATSLLAAGFRRMFNSPKPREAARALLAADEYAFAGYARWQINDRWDVFGGSSSRKPFETEERFFRRLLARPAWPAPLNASLSFRHYLAQRDLFVRGAALRILAVRRLLRKSARAESVAALRLLQAQAGEFMQALKAGRAAARAMWSRTRDSQVQGPNEAVLQADERRLKAWRDWLKLAVRQPELALQATPLNGAWQLQFMVHNFAPAVQKVVVEQQDADGIWRELAGRYTIEFRGLAARPRARIRREFTVPIVFPKAPLRIAVRGIGQVAISHASLTNGVHASRALTYHQKIILGRRAPTRGLPAIDWEKSSAALALVFLPPAASR